MKNSIKTQALIILVMAAFCICSPAFAMSEIEVTFSSGSNSISGILTLPDSEGPFPSLVLLHGSDRGAADNYIQEALELVKAGYAILRYDSPGTGSSTGSTFGETFDQRVAEALSAIDFLASRQEIKAEHIGLWGISQGGWICQMAAAQSEKVAFIIPVSGPGVSVAEQELFRVETESRDAGFSEEDIKKAVLVRLLLLDEILSEPRYKGQNIAVAHELGDGPWNSLLELVYPESALNAGDELQALVKILQKVHALPWSTYIGTQQVMPMLESLPAEAFPSVKAMMESTLFVDPANYLSKIHVPVLAIFGEKDASVPVNKSIEVYEHSFQTAGNKDLTVVTFPDANHIIHVDDKPASGYYSTMVDWLIGLEELLFTHVNILPMDHEQILEDYTLVVRDGKIVEMGPASITKFTGNAQVVDASGKFLIPALSDMHVHLEGDAWNIMYPPGSGYTSDELNYEDILFVYVAHGITTIQVMSAFPEHISIREKVKKHEIPGPKMVLSRMIDGAGKAWPPPISTWVNNPEEAAGAVRQAHEAGYDKMKVYSFLDRASYDTIMKTAASLNMPVDGHIPLSTSVDHIIASGQNMVAHSEEFLNFTDDYSQANIQALATSLARGEVWMTSTLITSRNLTRLFEHPEEQLSKPGTAYLHPMGADVGAYIYENLYKPIPESRREYIREGYTSFQQPFVKAFHSAGGKLLSGSDALIPPNLPGYELHAELEELVGAGLSPYEALRVSTRNAQEFLGDLETEGTIEAGKDANLVLLNANPLEDISNTREIVGVLCQGSWIPKEKIDARLEEIAQSYSELKKQKQ